MGDEQKVIELSDHLDTNDGRGYVTGAAVCTACGHRWVQVAPLPTDDLLCPECGTQRGYFVYQLSPPEGTPLWTCNNCDIGYLYYITPEGTYCARCGQKHDFD